MIKLKKFGGSNAKIYTVKDKSLQKWVEKQNGVLKSYSTENVPSAQPVIPGYWFQEI